MANSNILKFDNYSVLMSVYYKDQPIWLKEAIESIVNQKLMTNDFVIVEDGKLTEELENIILYYENKYSFINVIRNNKNSGLGHALSLGLPKCKNEIIARMDADDISTPDRFEIELATINKGFDLVGSDIYEFENSINNIKYIKKMPETKEEIIKYSKKRNPFNHPTVMFKKHTILQAGNYRNDYRSEDYDLWLRVININANVCNIPMCLVYMRTSSDFYSRRGGIKNYLGHKAIVNAAYKRGQFTPNEYVYNLIITFIKTCSPSFVRRLIYKWIIRVKPNRTL